MSNQAPILKWEITDSKVTSMVWGTLDETIITGHEAGDLIQWDLRVGFLLSKDISIFFIMLQTLKL